MEGNKDKISEYDEKVYDEVMKVNVKGVWLCMKYQIEQMMKQDLVETKGKPAMSRIRGNVVNCSSTAG